MPWAPASKHRLAGGLPASPGSQGTLGVCRGGVGEWGFRSVTSAPPGPLQMRRLAQGSREGTAETRRGRPGSDHKAKFACCLFSCFRVGPVFSVRAH